MKPVVVGSLTRSAGKTSVIIGLARAGGQPFAYLKPFGDRLLYRKKRQWDYDAALLANLFRLEEIPELITLGFDHSKLRFMFFNALSHLPAVQSRRPRLLCERATAAISPISSRSARLF